MRLRFSRVRWPEWLVGAGGLVLLGAMVLSPWYRRELPSDPKRRRRVAPDSAARWEGAGHGRWLTLATALAAFKVVFLQARQRAPALPMAATVFAALLGAVTVVRLIIHVWTAPAGERELGGWIGLVGGGAIAYGGYRSILMEGIDPADAPATIPTVALQGAGAGGVGAGSTGESAT